MITKISSLTNLKINNSKQHSLADQSFADSTISKRFSRKKNNTTQSNKQLSHAQAISIRGQNIQRFKKERVQEKGKVRVQDLFIQIVQTPTKLKKSYVPVSSDRTQSTYMREKQCNELAIPSNESNKKIIFQLKQQVSTKNDQIMCLQDQNMKMRRNIMDKQQQFIKANVQWQKQYQTETIKLKQQIKILDAELNYKNTEIQAMRNHSSNLVKEIKTLKIDKITLQKQLEQAYKRKLTKDLKELMSYRQISIMRELEQLKQKLHQNKSQNELQLEASVQKLKQDNQAKISQIKNLEIHNRILNRKLDQYQRSLKDNIQQFSKSYNCVKEQLKKMRKQNLKLKRLHILNLPQSIKKLQLYESSQQSLSLSLSSGR